MIARAAIVDDDPALVRLMTNVLTDCGWEVILCSDGDRAMSLLRHEQPDLIILNLWLETAMSGWALLRLLTGDPETRRIPVVVYCGGSGDAGDKDAWLTDHGIALLPKPLEIGDISQSLKGLQHRRATSTAGTIFSPSGKSEVALSQDARTEELEVLYIQLLGGFHVTIGSRVIEEHEWSLHKAKSVVKILALAPQHRMHREQFMDILWPNLGSAAATNNLHKTLHVARHTLEPELPLKSPSSYLHLRGEFLCLERAGQLQIDVDTFQMAARGARGTHNPIACEDALHLYGGELLPEDRCEQWTSNERTSLALVRCTLLLDLAHLRSQRAEIDLAIDALRQVVETDPLHEEAHAELMRLLAQAGYRHQALRQYQQLRDTLKRELDASPDYETQMLEQQIRRGR